MTNVRSTSEGDLNSAPPRSRVKRIVVGNIRSILSILRARNIQINHHRLLPATHNHSLYRLVLARIQLLVRNVRRHINKITGPRLLDKLPLISPAEPRPASHNINHGFQLPMMMRPGLGVGMYHDRSRPELLRADTSMRDSLGASHPWSLWSISIQFAAPNNAQPVILPVNLVVPVP